MWVHMWGGGMDLALVADVQDFQGSTRTDQLTRKPWKGWRQGSRGFREMERLLDRAHYRPYVSQSTRAPIAWD